MERKAEKMTNDKNVYMINNYTDAAVSQAVQFAGYRAAVRRENRSANPYRYELATLWEKGFDLAIQDLQTMP